jgi:hypothetical protein
MIATQTVIRYVQTVVGCTWGNVMNIGGDISLYSKIFTTERRQAEAAKHTVYVNFLLSYENSNYLHYFFWHDSPLVSFGLFLIHEGF